MRVYTHRRFVHTHKQRYTQTAVFDCVKTPSTGSPMLRGATRARHLHAWRIWRNTPAPIMRGLRTMVLCAMRTALPYLVSIAAMGGFILPREGAAIAIFFFLIPRTLPKANHHLDDWANGRLASSWNEQKEGWKPFTCTIDRVWRAHEVDNA